MFIRILAMFIKAITIYNNYLCICCIWCRHFWLWSNIRKICKISQVF